MTSRVDEVGGSKEIEQEVSFKRKIAKEILVKLTEDRNDVTIEEIQYLKDWLVDTGNYSEDAAVVIEHYLQENDILIFDKELYYKDLMEN